MEIDYQPVTIPFSYVKERYGVKADMHREVIVGGKKGVITKDMGNYIGVNFYDKPTYYPCPCHPTSEVVYLETLNHKPPIEKLSQSKKRYLKYLSEDSSLSFSEWMGFKSKYELSKAKNK